MRTRIIQRFSVGDECRVARARLMSGRAAAQVIENRNDAESRSAFADVSMFFVRARGTRDVDVSPGDLTDEFLEEQPGRERAAPAVTGVLEIRDLRFELLRQARWQRQPPHLLARLLGR